jgi:S1-C subfamily serine protease
MATTTRPREDARVHPERVAVRDRLLPRTVLGLTVVILAASVGAAFSGAVLYAYYEYRLSQNERAASRFAAEFDERFRAARETIEAERQQARAEVRNELEPLRKIRAEGETLEALAKKVQASVWFVTTLDEAGQPSVGSAFVVASDGTQSLMVTSYATVRAATRKPGPAVTVRKGEELVGATLWTWHEEKDLALLTVPKGNVPKLTFASGNSPIKVGERVFSVSGLGAMGAAISQGFVADVSAAGIQHDAAVGSAFQGGPLVTSNGEVVAVASRAYAPLGFGSDEVFFGVPIRAVCEKVLKCPGGSVGGPGDRS